MEENMEIIWIVMIMIGIIMFYVAEIGAYFWHRFGAHTEIIDKVSLNTLKVKQTHDIHHTIIDDEAHADFFYVCFLLFFYLVFLYLLFYYDYLSFSWLLVLYLPVFITLVWNWYVHSAYHQEDHWLSKYEWFKHDKFLHMNHHIDPNCNYGIATHFTDEILDTMSYS